MRVAVVGAGITGLTAAFELAKAGVEVVIYEKEDYIGGHARTISVDGIDLDIGFMVFNLVTYPNMMEMFNKLGVEMEASDMSFSVSLDEGKGCEWGSKNGLASLFAQKSNLINPYFWLMLREIIKFKDDVDRYLMEHEENPAMAKHETLEVFLKSHGYSELFQKAYLVPICASIWSCPSTGVMNFSAYSVLSFCRNHHLIQLFNRPQWFTIKNRSLNYVNKLRGELESRCCQIKLGCAVQLVSSINNGCSVLTSDHLEQYDECLICIHAPDALKVLGEQITYEESRILCSFQYIYSDIYVHRDTRLMPQNPSAWGAWNFLGSTEKGVYLTYWLNVVQNLGSSHLPFLLTFNPPYTPKHEVLKWTTSHPIPSVAASKASIELEKIQGIRRIWFAGAFQGYGFHEDGIKAGLVVVSNILGKELKLLKNPKHMVPCLMEAGARMLVTKFLKRYISIGSLILLEEGGTAFHFDGKNKSNLTKSLLKVNNPLFYWKVATEADVGLADAYINGYFSFVDDQGGLLNFILVLIGNQDLINCSNINQNKRGWWMPLLLTASFASSRYYFQHCSRKNSLNQARLNISRHYDLSNHFFSLFLDETMTYSCAIFKDGNEDLQVAQQCKLSLLIDKAKIEPTHEVLEIGFGWGSLAIEIVKRTGCKYIGITLSIVQLNFAKRRVNEAGLEDNITLLLCDYRQFSCSQKFDRIISCEMIEGVGNEYLDQFFGCCENLLAEHGLLILQFISIPDQRYDEYKRSSDFIKEYIFPGACLPSLSRIISAMAASSKLCVENVENIGIHYYKTLVCWRNNFMANKSNILALGFDDKFIRTWEYYFIYCAAGFKSRTLGDYQVIFSRPGNVKAFNSPCEICPSSC